MLRVEAKYDRAINNATIICPKNQENGAAAQCLIYRYESSNRFWPGYSERFIGGSKINIEKKSDLAVECAPAGRMNPNQIPWHMHDVLVQLPDKQLQMNCIWPPPTP